MVKRQGGGRPRLSMVKRQGHSGHAHLTSCIEYFQLCEHDSERNISKQFNQVCGHAVWSVWVCGGGWLHVRVLCGWVSEDITGESSVCVIPEIRGPGVAGSSPCTLTTSLATPVPSSSSLNGPTTTPLITRGLCPHGSVVWTPPEFVRTHRWGVFPGSNR